MKKLLIKYRSFILYMIFGVLTTLVNIVTYYVMARLLNLETMTSTIIAWTVAVLFAYLTNRALVFESEAKSKKCIIKEIISFFSCRLLTGFVDWGFMFIFVDICNFNDIFIKTIANIIVIILNYVASKLIIFKKSKKN